MVAATCYLSSQVSEPNPDVVSLTFSGAFVLLFVAMKIKSLASVHTGAPVLDDGTAVLCPAPHRFRTRRVDATDPVDDSRERQFEQGESRQHGARIQDPQRIERVLDPPVQLHDVLTELSG